MAIESNIFQWIAGTMDQTLNTFVSVTSASVINDFTFTVTLLGMLYFVMLGYMMIHGQVESAWFSFIKSCGKFIIICALAMNSGTYMGWVVGSLQGLETGLASAFAAHSGGPSTTVFQVIDKSISDGFQIGSDMLSKMGKRKWYEMSMMFFDLLNALIIYVATLIIAIPAGAMIVVSKAMLSIMLGIGPIFIMMLLFGQFTSRWFDNWIGQVITYILQIALISAVLSFGMKFFSTLTEEVLAEPAGYPFSTTLEILIVTCVVFYMLQQANAVAGGLAGGISSAGLTLRGLANGATSPINRVLNPKSTRHDLSTGKSVSASRLSHMVSGNTVWNPAYRQHVMSNIGKNWGNASGGTVKK